MTQNHDNVDDYTWTKTKMQVSKTADINYSDNYVDGKISYYRR